MDMIPPVIDESKLQDFGRRIFALYQTHKTDRKAAEERWLRALRQFRGIYDPEVLAMIPANKSKAYPKLTRWKVIGTVARLMQMLFPSTEKNYGVKASPLPDLPAEQLQKVLNDLVAAKAEAMQTDPRDVLLEDEEIEKAVLVQAKSRAERMELKVDDDLQEMQFITLARKVVFSAVLYNVGVLQGPLHIAVKVNRWQRDPNKGGYTVVEVEKYKPLFEFQPVWGWYPDMSAAALNKQDGTFIRHIMARWEVEALAKRPDFLKERIERWLREHTGGNYQAEWWETVMKAEAKSDRSLVASKEDRKYEAAAYYGGVTGHDLRAAGVQVADEALGKTFQANVWTIGDLVIKAKLAPFDGNVRQHHWFLFEEDDLSLLGNGQCDTLRDSQLSLCEVTRAALDDMSVIGPMVEINDDLVTPGQNLTIRKHMTIHREGEGQSANMAAVRPFNIESNLTDLLALRETFLDSADKESGLPPPSLGDVSGGGSEALRTQRNASMFLGAAALPIRDTVRNYDDFTISVISALVAWNRKYDADAGRDGDHNIIARGSTSLIAKEVLSQSLDDLRQTLTPDEMPHVKTRALLRERMKARDLPLDELLEDEDVANQRAEAQQQAQQAQIENEMQLTDAQAAAFVTKSLTNIAQAKKLEGAISIDTFKAVIAALESGDKLALDTLKLKQPKKEES
ncbi:MAG: hypothetical protein DDT20_00860 [Firmicutes bacterium]|nr:hypothetical protein [Bacillota bacterium]